jgi:hypothetical protein
MYGAGREREESAIKLVLVIEGSAVMSPVPMATGSSQSSCRVEVPTGPGIVVVVRRGAINAEQSVVLEAGGNGNGVLEAGL